VCQADTGGGFPSCAYVKHTKFKHSVAIVEINNIYTRKNCEMCNLAALRYADCCRMTGPIIKYRFYSKGTDK